MELTLPSSFWPMVQKSSQILILFPKDKKGESAPVAALALMQFLRKNKIQAEIACQDFSRGEKLAFLPDIAQIQPNIKIQKKFVVSIDISKSEVEEFSYNINDTKLNIFITPKNGTLFDKDISTRNSEYRYDLIITLATPDLEMLGKIYNENAEFFYNTPIINIDNSVENEQYGQINIVDFTAASLCEIIYAIMTKTQPNAIDREIATSLLTGIIIKTRGFRSNHITPKTLETVSLLISAGAQREKIIHNLYQTKSIETLRLWGKALANLKHEKDIGLVWTSLAGADLGTHNDEELHEVNDELINTSPDAKIVCLLYQTPQNQFKCLMGSAAGLNAANLTKAFKSTGTTNTVEFSLPVSTVNEASQLIIDELKKNLKPMLA